MLLRICIKSAKDALLVIFVFGDVHFCVLSEKLAH